MLAEVAGSLIACVRVKLSMRALESAYLNGVSHGKKMSYLFFPLGRRNANQTLRCVRNASGFFNWWFYVEANRKKRLHLDAQKFRANDFSPQILISITSKYPCNLKVSNYLLSSAFTVSRNNLAILVHYYIVKFMSHTFIAKSVPRVALQ